MKFFNNLSQFVTASRASSVKAANVRSFSGSLPEGVLKNSETVELPREGLSALLSGHHVYAMLQLRPGLTTSSSNEDRRKTISLLAELVQGVREVAHKHEGAVLEAQGPVVHVFLPDANDAPRDARQAAMEIHEFIDDKIKRRAGSDFLKALVSYSHGTTILVSAENSHADDSIVSLAPAANAPAKVLWKNWETLPTGAILEVEIDGRFRELTEEDRQTEVSKSAGVIFNAAKSLGDVILVEARAAEMPDAGSPDSPTVEDPHRSFSVSFRADVEGFTQRVMGAFHAGEEAMQELAIEFYEIMVHAREFCHAKECIHLPWAGDCFNLLLSFEDRESYQETRARRILTVALQFRDHMGEKFPDLEWAFSSAAGFLEPAQACNTLVSRLTVGHTTLLLATGLPVERSLQGLIRESPDAGCGVLWKGDVEKLDADLQEIIDDTAGGENYRHYTLENLEAAEEAFDFSPPPPAYTSPVVAKNVSIVVPTVKPHFP